MKIKRTSNTTWLCRKHGSDKNAYVQCSGNNNLFIGFDCAEIGFVAGCIDRKLARLLAKRINQCLDENT